MVNILIVAILISFGFYFKKINILPQRFELGLNKILIYFFIPILTFLYLPELRFSLEHLWLILTPWIIYLGSITYFYGLNKIFQYERSTLGALIMTSGIGSISFVGLPIFDMFYGQRGLEYGIILSLGGTFVVCNSIGTITGVWFKDHQPNFKKVIRGIFTFPPFLVMLLSFVLMLFNYQHPLLIKSILTKLSSPFSVLALLSIGLQIDIKGFNTHKKHFFMGTLYKLVLAPFIIFGILFLFGMHDSVVGQICILGAGIGAMNTIAIIAADFDLQPKLALLMPALSIPISVFSIILIYYLIQ